MQRNKVYEYYKRKAKFCKGSGGTLLCLCQCILRPYLLPHHLKLYYKYHYQQLGPRIFHSMIIDIPHDIIIMSCCNSLNNKEDPETYKKPLLFQGKRI